MVSKHGPAALLATLGLAGPASTQDAWIVDADGDPGADFTSIQAAVDAAGAGDTVFVRSGSYAGVHVDGKPLHIVGAPDFDGAEPVLHLGAGGPLLLIENVPAGEEVVVRGLTVATGPIEARASAGSVYLEFVVSGAGVQVADCADFVATRSTLFGGVDVSGSTVHLFDTSFLGPTAGTGLRLELSLIHI